MYFLSIKWLIFFAAIEIILLKKNCTIFNLENNYVKKKMQIRRSLL